MTAEGAVSSEVRSDGSELMAEGSELRAGWVGGRLGRWVDGQRRRRYCCGAFLSPPYFIPPPVATLLGVLVGTAC